MTKKLALIAFCFCACFGLVGITYADTYASTTKENTAEQEQEINIDQYLNNGDKSLHDVIYGVSGDTASNKLLKGRPSKPNANRGYFWVTWEGEKFAAHFDNDYYTHRVVVKNSNSSKWYASAWVPKGTRATRRIFQTLTGNKAKWATK